MLLGGGPAMGGMPAGQGAQPRAGGAGGSPQGSIRVTKEEMDAISRLQALGFS